MEAEESPRDLRCSFCGFDVAEVGMMVEGSGAASGLPMVRICANCIDAASSATSSERHLDTAKKSAAPSSPPPIEDNEPVVATSRIPRHAAHRYS